MSSIKRGISLLLCITMLIPSQIAWGTEIMPEDTISYEDIYEEDMIETKENIEIQASTESWMEDGHYQATVPLTPLESEHDLTNWSGEPVIYWNPGNDGQDERQIPLDFGTPSEATRSNAVGVSIREGSDHADGLTPHTPVKNLNTAIRKAERLSRKMEIDVSDITIYAMKPMLVPRDMMYTVRGKGVTIKAWQDRADNSDLIFAIDGGQLALHNLILQPVDGGSVPEDAPLVYVQSGKVQLGEKVEVYGGFILDYEQNQQFWEWASRAEAASESDSGQYIEPVIELLKKFEPASNYVLDIKIGDDYDKVTAVHALFSDDQTTEEFVASFQVVDHWSEDWEIHVEEWIGGVLRDTTEESEAMASEAEAESENFGQIRTTGQKENLTLTQKSLVLSRSTGDERTIYWNPGEEITTADGDTYPQGDDQNHDGRVPEYPVKSWENAKERAKGGTIVCMQTIDLSKGDATSVLGPLENGSYVLDGERSARVTLTTLTGNPVVSIPDGAAVTLRNVTLHGQSKPGSFTGSQLILCQGGQLILDHNVQNKIGYIQVDLKRTNQAKNHPIIIDSEDVTANLYFGGIHHDIDWRYQDVAIAGNNLLAIGEQQAGDVLLSNIKLEAANTITIEAGGLSEFAWVLRQDTAEDDGVAQPSRLELYTEYYFHGVYLDGIRGTTNNYGATCSFPVDTFAAARQILITEINRSVTARAEAASQTERDKISVPRYIFVCGTVTVTDQQLWELPDFKDWDDTPINIEIKTHTDPLIDEDTDHAIHEIEDLLFYVKGSGADLTLGKNILIRSIADKVDSYTLAVDTDANVTLIADAELTALQNASDVNSQTLGTHILVGKNPRGGTISKGSLTMDVNWAGSINGRGIGVEAYGSNSVVRMFGGEIKNNKNTISSGAGIYLNQALLQMQGGKVSSNYCTNNGAGIYLNQAKFEMTEGLIEKNKSLVATNFPVTDGIGVYVGSNSSFTMGELGADPEKCVIQEQEAIGVYRGVGIHVVSNGTFELRSGIIRNNRGRGSSNSVNVYQASLGGGIYSAGTFFMKGGIVSGNGAQSGFGYSNLKGGGIFLTGSIQELTGGTISDNRTGAFYSSSLAYTGGGGIYIERKALLQNLLIENNRSYFGGGIAASTANEIRVEDCVVQNNIATSQHDAPVSSIDGYGGGIYSQSNMKVTGGEITGNQSTQGGGYHANSYLNSISGALIENNYALYNGGGIYNNASGLLVADVTINLNSAESGAGIYNGSGFYGANVKITNNRASNRGGGIENISTIYLTDQGAGRSELVGNEALQGGGIYNYYGSVFLDISTTVQNKAVGAAAQGNNMYLTQHSNAAGNVYLVSGDYQQPTDSTEGVYNIYLDRNGANSAELILDPTKVTIGGDDKIYLQSTDNYLRYLAAPPHNNYKTLPIDVNTDVFSIGSVVIKPANRSNITMVYPNAALTATTFYTVSYSLLKDASINMPYSEGGRIPERTQLGGYPDEITAGLTNAVLVGEGVYLRGEKSDGTGGKDTNSGTSPTDAVATFARAKQLLESRTDAANTVSGGAGFSPFIYICGNVPITNDENWTLDFDEARYTTDSNYVVTETAAGRVVELAQIKRFTSFISAPMITILGNGTTFTVPKLIVNGMSESVITRDQGDKSPVIYVNAGNKVILQDEAWIRNNYRNMIEMYGELLLTGSETSSNRQIDVTRGDGVNLYSGGSMKMDEYARVIISQKFPDGTSYTGYHSLGYTNRGVVIRPKAILSMHGKSKIVFTDIQNSSSIANSTSVGVVIGSSTANADKAQLFMHDSSSISQFRMGIGLENYAVSINLLNQASINNNTDGIYSYGKGRADILITMNGESTINNNQNRGIMMEWQSAGVESDAISILMMGSSAIRDNGVYGIQMYNIYPRLQLEMMGNSKIVNNASGGIGEASYAQRSAIITMRNQSWIGTEGSGKQAAGIIIGTGPEFSGDKTDLFKVLMYNDAMIGGDASYGSTGAAARKGNQIYGIYTNKPITIEMNNQSKISYNGGGSNIAHGIYLAGNSSYTGNTMVTMQGNAAITDNRGYGIYSEAKLANNTYYRYEKFIIKNNAAIKNNNYGNYFMYNSDVYLSDTADIGAATNTGQDTINMSGSLHLDGTVSIAGPIRLMTGNKPIELCAAVSDENLSKRYNLYLAEGFVGQIVVKPDGTNVSDATLFFEAFHKVEGVGMAATKNLKKKSPDIMLEGENNVYLSSYGNDDNSGITPSTSVRTFKRAKELLKTGDFSSGANILICNVPGKAINIPVQIALGDEQWSFDDGGYVTNQQSGDRWKPVVFRHETYYGPLIQLHSGSVTVTDHVSADSVTFKNITIDGQGNQADISQNIADNKQILRVMRGTAILGEEAILQNNHRNFRNQTVNANEYVNMGVYVGVEGSLVMTGGSINGMGIENYYNSVGNNTIGVAVLNYGKVEISDGSIHDNTISNTANWSVPYLAGTVMNANDSNFIMTGGSISSNVLTPVSSTNAVLSGGALSFADNSSGVMKGGLITDNKGGAGAGLYYQSTKPLELEGGRIRNNQSVYGNSVGSMAPIYVSGDQFWLQGGGMLLDDIIYLDSTDHIISVRANIYQTSRRYQIHLNRGTDSKQFQKGSVVVQPDGQYVLDATKYLGNFEVQSNPYILDKGQSEINQAGTVSGLVESQCLLLMQAVYLDSQNGSDSNQGTNPKDAVASFARAKDIGEGTDKGSSTRDYFVIYISGPVEYKNGEIWELADISYMCRYTGFGIYHSDGRPSSDKNYPYSNYLIETDGELTLKNVRIYGRRTIDESTKNGDSIIRIRDQATVNLLDGTVLTRNYNIGSYLSQETGLLVALSMRGGAVTVENGGTLNISGGTITDMEATFGKAIYLDAETTEGGSRSGHLNLSNELHIEGDIYLNGQIHKGQAYVQVSESYAPAILGRTDAKLRIRLANDYSGRPVIKYPDSVIPTLEQVKYYQLDDSITAIYDFTRNMLDSSLLELQLRQLLYVDGVSGDDDNTGANPEDSLKSLKGVYTRLNQMGASTGALVFVVNTLGISTGKSILLTNEAYRKNGIISYRGTYDDGSDKIEIDAQIYFKRYAQPDSSMASGYNVPTNKKSLFTIEKGGMLSLSGIFLDGHSEESLSSFDYLCAQGVDAESPLIIVKAGGDLKAYAQKDTTPRPGEELVPASDTARTLFTNNHNAIEQKDKLLGTNEQGIQVFEGSSAGIEILSEGAVLGAVRLEGVEFKNLSLAMGLDGGTDVYQNGHLQVLGQTIFSGSLMLEGLGGKSNPGSSRYIEIMEYGRPIENNFNVIIRDAYDGRAVVQYPNTTENGPMDRDLGFYLLEEQVNRYFALHKRDTAKHILELTVPLAVYLDGQNGNDANGGWRPIYPVKTLQKAYERLRENGGKVIYIVGTVDINSTIDLSATLYESGGQKVSLLGNTDHVDIRRYVRPLAGEAGTNYDPEYNRDDFNGIMLRIKDGGQLTLKDNVYLDGHYQAKTDLEYTSEFRVEHTTEVTVPMVQVDHGGTLKLMEQSLLKDNHNTKALGAGEQRVPGGAINNSGNVELTGGFITDNAAVEGAGIYQNGIFKIVAMPEGIEGQEIYLTTVNSGTEEDPIWGADRTLDTAVLLANNLKLDLQMDRPMAGRPVVKYTSHTGVDAQYVHYTLGDTVPVSLFLTESGDNDSLLELQDWRILDISVPKEIFLIVQKDRTGEIRVANAATGDLNLAGPQYTVKNHGRYAAMISLSGFINQNTAAGITEYEAMNLVASAANAASESAGKNDLYLAIKGSDVSGGFSELAETSFYGFGVDNVKRQKMGVLSPEEEGNFIFIAAASNRFMNQFADSEFPFYGGTIHAETRKAHLRHQNLVTGETSANHARAKYKMTYRVEMIPSRR